MDPVSSFSGLISGIDFQALAETVAAAESAPIRVLESKVASLTARSAGFRAFEALAQEVEIAAAALRKGDSLQLRTVSVKGQAPIPLIASADATSSTGTHIVKVLSLATNERLGGSTFSSITNALGLSGEFLINGKAVSVASSDSLVDVVNTINGLNTGSDPSQVSASILTLGTDSHRLVLTAEDSGALGINLSDSAGGMLRSLGLLDSTVSIKNATSDGAKSDSFVNSTLTVSSLLGLASPPASAAVTIGTFTATIDLATMSLDAIASEINTKAGIALSSVTATVVQETVDGKTLHRLDISGTTSFTDANRILEVLGVLKGGQSSAAQTLQAGNTLEGADLVTPATAATRMDALSDGGVAAGVADGDTLSISGTRGDGSAFSFTYTVANADTIQELLDRLNSAVDGLKVGSRTATASIDANGRLIVTDDTAGSSQLSISIVANNEGGGTLDFGAISVSQAGLDREMVKGADATLEVDGVFLTRKSNNVTDALTGVTLELQAADAANPATVTITHEVGAAVAQIQALIDAYNKLTSFVSAQMAPPAEGQPKSALHGSSALRSMRTQMRDGLQVKIASGVAGNLTRLFDIGIEIDKTGNFTVDTAKLTTQIEADATAVVNLLGITGTGSTSDIDYVSASDKVVSGIYNVQVTQVATQATVTGTGFGATYVDDATADTMTVRDLSTNSNYAVSLANGDTLQTIVNKLNAQFDTALPEIQKAATAVYSDAVLTTATEATLLNSVFNSGGTNTGIANGDTFTISGTTTAAASILLDFVVTDITTQTLGDLTAAVQGQLGAGTRVYIDTNGLLTAEDKATGLSLLTLSISSDNAGGGTFSLGSITSTQKGRAQADITASVSGGELKLDHVNYGTAEGFEITYAAGGTDGTASLGVAAATYAGLDVAATLGGLAATGLGQLLTGDADTAVEGLLLKYTGTTTGAVGNIDFSRGIASTLEEITEAIIGTGVGSVDELVDTQADQITRLKSRIKQMEARVENRRLRLIKRFVAAEQALARQSQQTQMLLSQLGISSNG